MTLDSETKTAGGLLDVVPGLKAALDAGAAIDLALPGAMAAEQGDGISSSLVVWLNPTGDFAALDSLTDKRQYILIRNVLPFVDDYRTLLRKSFSKLSVGGWLVITVPHQFLYERKFRLPSRYKSAHRRFYTPASLLMEVEEALVPTDYRVRLLHDDDTLFDYEAPIESLATGSKRIVLVLQRISRPRWADHLNHGDDVRGPAVPSTIAPLDSGSTKTHIITSDESAINSILVVKLDHRGDYLMAESTLEELGKAFPGAALTLVCGSWNASSARASGLFVEVLSFDFFDEDHSSGREPPRELMLRRFAELMRGRAYDLAIDLRYFADTRPLLRSVNALYTAGIDNWNAFPWIDVRLDLPAPTYERQIEAGFFPTERFQTKIGRKVEFAIHYAGRTRTRSRAMAAWGPYASLSSGEYEFEFLISPSTKHEQMQLQFDITCDGGNKTLFVGELKVKEGENPKIYLDFPKNIEGVELRIFVPGKTTYDFIFSGVRYRRSGQVLGYHQRETMHLLVQLTAERLRQPYTDEVVNDG